MYVKQYFILMNLNGKKTKTNVLGGYHRSKEFDDTLFFREFAFATATQGSDPTH